MKLKEEEMLFDRRANRTYPSWLEIEIPLYVFLRLDVKRIVDASDFLAEMNPVIMNPAVDG